MKPLLEQNLTQDELRFVWAALKTRNALKKREIKENEFNMNTFQRSLACSIGQHACGTSHCIGGWIDFYLHPTSKYNGDPTERGLDLSENFIVVAKRLFYPSDYKMDNSKREHGIQAIDNFLAGRKNPWNGVKV